MERAGFILKGNKGFTLLESMVAISLLLSVTITIIPSLSHIRMLQKELSIERHTLSTLHDELNIVRQESLPVEKNDEIYPKITYQFTKEENLIKGCVKWENSNEAMCLYKHEKE